MTAPTAADLRAIRERVGSQDAVARMLGCPQSTISRLEGGTHPPKMWHALALLYLAEHEGRTPWDEAATVPAAPPARAAAR